jgi:hypothetical protein
MSAVSSAPYRQSISELGLSIERATATVPDDGAYHLRRKGETLGRFRSLKAAQAAWADAVRELDWKPTRSDNDATIALRREKAERWSRNRAG